MTDVTRRDNRHWTHFEIAKFTELWLAGVSTGVIAMRLGRSKKALRQLATRLRAKGVDIPQRARGLEQRLVTRRSMAKTA